MGHSERRLQCAETDAVVAAKLARCQEHQMHAIVCIGETSEEREAGHTHEVLRTQLEALKPSIKDWSRVVIAYEPVWAIGTGKTAFPEMAQDAHDFIRKWVAANAAEGPAAANQLRIVYGGSVKDSNAESLIACKDVDGFLVGSASMTEGFATIVEIVNKAAHS